MTDALGSVHGTLDNSGSLQASQQFDPWGQPTGSDQPAPWGFTGEYQDTTSTLIYLRARWYHPTYGVFLSPDPFEGWINTPYSLHDYQYAYSDPVQKTDPTGQCVTCKVQEVPQELGETIGDAVSEVGESLGDAYTTTVNGVGDAGQTAITSFCDAMSETAEGLGRAFQATGRGLQGAYTQTANGIGVAYDATADGLGTAYDATVDAVQKICFWCNPVPAPPGGTGANGGPAANCSFQEDTLVTTPDGQQPISTLAPGDLVTAYNEATQETGNYTITAIIIHDDPNLVDLVINGEQIKTTYEHPFMVKNRGWIAAEELNPGDRIIVQGGSIGVVESVQIRSQSTRMYNLTVAIAHTFFVGKQQWLVHNACYKHYYKGVVDTTIDAEGQSGVDQLGRLYTDRDPADPEGKKRLVSWFNLLHSTVALAKVEGITYVTYRGDNRLEAELISAANRYGWTYIQNPKRNSPKSKDLDHHAESFLYDHLNNQGMKVDRIAITFRDGPCKDYCFDYFKTKDVHIYWDSDFKK